MKKSSLVKKGIFLGLIMAFAGLSMGAMCDNDNDGYYYTTFSSAVSYAKDHNYTMDCNDHDPMINPGAEEICDGVDDNCDGILLDGETIDADEDGLLACEDDNDVEIDALVEVKPEAMKLNEGEFTASVELPAPYDSASIVECYADGAEALSIHISHNKVLCKFNVLDISELPVDTYFEVYGYTDEGFAFWGADEIGKVIE